jgi:tRNA (guanine26-N2/guanine27-N2)-dimethyltransferase
LKREITSEPRTAKSAGPLWAGGLLSKELLGRMKATGDLGTAVRCDRMLETWHEEADAPPLFYSMDELARKTKLSPPKLLDFVEYLQAKGGVASRTHFDPKGLRTDLSAAKLVTAYKRFPRDK